MLWCRVVVEEKKGWGLENVFMHLAEEFWKARGQVVGRAKLLFSVPREGTSCQVAFHGARKVPS